MAHEHADATDAARLFLRIIPEHPGEHDAWRLGALFTQFGFGGYRIAMDHAKSLYAELHPGAVCTLMEGEGKSCCCFGCRVDGLLAALPEGA